jgi:hypothetical protein
MSVALWVDAQQKMSFSIVTGTGGAWHPLGGAIGASSVKCLEYRGVSKPRRPIDNMKLLTAGKAGLSLPTTITSAGRTTARCRALGKHKIRPGDGFTSSRSIS